MTNDVIPLFADLAIILVLISGLLFITICLIKIVRLSINKVFQSGERADKNCNQCKWVEPTRNYGNWCNRPHRLSGDSLHKARGCKLERSWLSSIIGGCGPDGKYWEAKE